MGHGRSGHHLPFRVASTLKLSLSDAGAIPDTPLVAMPHGSKWRWSWSAETTTVIRLSAISVDRNLGLLPDDISKQEIRDGGTMALLLGGIDYEKPKF